MTRVVLTNVSKTFARRQGKGVPAIQHLNLSVEPGELLVLVGPSGCGKTTTLRLIAGLERVTSGTIEFNGTPVTTVPPQDRDVAMVFQQDALLPHLTVAENISLGLRLRGVKGGEVKSRTQEASGLLGVTELMNRRPGALSAGERQRVAMARAFVRRPRVFLFDEPMANLDPPVRMVLRGQILELHRRTQATMIYVTHDQAEAMSFNRRIAVMQAGVVAQIGVPEELYSDPANAFVAGFLGLPPMNIFRGALLRQGGALWFHERGNDSNLAVCLTEAQGRVLEPWLGKEVQVGLRPEHIVDGTTDRALPYGSEVEAIAVASEPGGHERWECFRSGPGGTLFRARFPGDHFPPTPPGETRALVFDMSRAFFFESSGKRIVIS